MKIFGFGHRKQVGKDMVVRGVAELLEEKDPSLYIYQDSFAGCVYDVCEKLYGWLGFRAKSYYDKNPKEKEIKLPKINKTPREILINLGTYGIRDKVWENTWCEYLLAKYDYSLTNAVLLISDLRFPNEFRVIKERGGKCCKIVRPQAPRSDDVADKALSGYISEWDYVFMNTGTPQQLIELVYNEIQNS